MKVFYLIIKSRVRIILLMALFNNNVFSQINLVPNPSFEVYDTCPNSSMYGHICRAIPWFQPYYPEPINCGGSSNYFHICDGSVPNTGNGFQYPRTGDGLTHIIIYIPNTINNGREYMEVELINSLLPDKKYCAFFYSVYTIATYSQLSCDCLGISFSIDTLKQYGSYDIINAPSHIKSQTIITDTVNWSLVKGIYTAGGGEKFMTVGCFLPYTQVSHICYSTPSNCAYSAYFFDDFGLYELPEIEAGNNDTICATGGSVQLNANCTGCWSGLQYRWWPSVGLNDTTILNPTASPTQTTTYYFGLTDTSNTVPCIIDLIDSVTIYVIDTCGANTPTEPIQHYQINPTASPGNFILSYYTQENSNIKIYDALGRVVYREALLPVSQHTQHTQHQVMLPHLAQGMYIFVIEQNNKREYTKKIVIVK
jgi:hypothetical protein